MPRYPGRTTPDEFEQLVRPHLDHLMRVARRLTDDPHMAEDLVQDVLVKLYPKQRQLASIDSLRPWLARVLYRHFIDDRRRFSRSPVQLMADQPGATPGDPLAEVPDGARPGPEASAVEADERQRVNRALGRLSPDHRLIIGLHDVEGYTLVELEAILDTPLGTLKSRLHRARARLRELLGERTD